LFTGSNSDDQKVKFALQTALNLTYAHLQVKNFYRGLYTRTPVKRVKGREEREGREGQRGEGWNGKERGERVGKEYGQEGRGRGG
jgi:hypothetical protein